jgi:putative MATE family efflux protein
MDDKRIDLLKNGKVNKAINKMAAPAIIGMLVMAIYNVVDSMFVSWLGDFEIAAAQVVLPIMLIASAVGLSFGIGGGTYVSRLLGNNKKDEADKVASVSFFSGLVVGILLMVVSLIFLDPILQFFGSNEDTHELAKTYGTYIIIGFGFTVLSMIMNNMLRSEGSGVFSMIGMAIGSILNIILDPIFLFVFDMGIGGAAIATTISQAVTTLVLLSMYLRKKSIIKIGISYFKPSLVIYKEILVVGIPTFFRQMLVSLSLGLLNNAATLYGGTELLSATSVVVKVTMIPNYIIFGFGQGFQPVAGFNYGAKNKQRVMDGFKYTLRVSTYIMVFFFLLFTIFDDAIFDIFRSSAAVREYGKTALRWYMFGFLFLGASNTISIFYQAIGKGTEALILSVARQGLFFIPLILILPNIIGVDGVLMSQAISDILSLILSLSLVIPFTTSKKFHLLMEPSS